MHLLSHLAANDSSISFHLLPLSENFFHNLTSISTMHRLSYAYTITAVPGESSFIQSPLHRARPCGGPRPPPSPSSAGRGER